MEFIKNELINQTLAEFYNTFSVTLDTGDFVPQEFNKKIYKYIFKNLKEKFKIIDIFYLLELESRGVKLTSWQRLKVWFSGLRPCFKSLKEFDKKQKRKTLGAVKEKAGSEPTANV